MKLSKWTLFCALLVAAALSLAGCMNAGNRAGTAAPSPSAGATAGTGSGGRSRGREPVRPGKTARARARPRPLTGKTTPPR